MPTPMPHQLEGAAFLAARNAALLADEPRVGKTGAAIIACDYVLAKKVLVVTTASGRADWGYQFRQWQKLPRKVQVIYGAKDKLDPAADVVVIGWPAVWDRRHDFLAHRDVLVLDEGHQAKNKDAKRTQAVYGTFLEDGQIRVAKTCLSNFATHTWPASGTPVPNAPNDLWPMLRALTPQRLWADTAKGWPDVTRYSAFCNRYCVMRKKYVGGQWIEYAIKGKNEEELRERLTGFWLRRTQQDVGIRAPIYSVFPLHSDSRGLDSIDAQAALAAAEQESVDDGELAKIRRLVGTAKAQAVIEAVKERFEDGLDKVVLMAWHTDVIDALRSGLSAYGVVGIDGRTPATRRASEVEAFRGSARVFVGQILAAGENIDLSSACELWFVEPSFTPKDMKQAALRITNHTQTRQALVRVCALEGSIDEALMEILTRKVASISKITKE